MGEDGMELNGKVAFITGGGGGIGEGIAEAFAEQDMKLVLADLDQGRAQAQADKYGDGAFALKLDVTSLDSWAAARAEALGRFGQVDVLCNNAGVSIPWNPLVDVPVEEFDLAIKVNLYGVYFGVKTFGPHMMARRSGHIVNTSSFNGLLSMGPMGPYSASKSGVTALSVSLRQEMAAYGVGVSTVYPGATRSRMTSSIQERHKDVMRTRKIMEPVWIGRAIVKAIEQNEAHIISHPNLRPAWDAWVGELAASFGEPADPDYRV
jgi:NAD(P)-dependent dehydrogenase (short-subunit alcohol dehydrogenase family)